METKNVVVLSPVLLSRGFISPIGLFTLPWGGGNESEEMRINGHLRDPGDL